MPVDALDVASVTSQFAFLRAREEVEDANEAVVGAAGEFRVVRRESTRERQQCIRSTRSFHLRQSSDGIRVRLVDFHIVHIRLPVFHKTVMIAGQHPLFVVRPDHRSNG